MNNSLAIRNESITLRNMDDVTNAAKAMSASGYFQDAGQAAQAVVKILAGQEMGFGPFASMTGIYIIKGRPSVSAALMANAIKRSGKYDYKVVTLTDKLCELDFFQGAEAIGRSSFSLEDAKKAGTQNLDKFARNMLFARAMSNGQKWFCPDVFDGPVYTPEEMGATVDGEGNVLDLKAEIITPSPVTPEKLSPPATHKSPDVANPQAEKTAQVAEVLDNAPSEPTPVSEAETMTLDEANKHKNDKGVEYGALETSTLTYMNNRMGTLIMAGNGKPEYAEKIVAIRMILASRK